MTMIDKQTRSERRREQREAWKRSVRSRRLGWCYPFRWAMRISSISVRFERGTRT